MFTCVFFFSDDDECSLGIHNCIQTCTNTAGSFLCGCTTGFQLNSDGTTCDGEYYMKDNLFLCIIICTKSNIHSNHVDIDECNDGTHDCSQTCTNTMGSFVCGCNVGYHLDDDDTTCIGMY